MPDSVIGKSPVNVIIKLVNGTTEFRYDVVEVWLDGDGLQLKYQNGRYETIQGVEDYDTEEA